MKCMENDDLGIPEWLVELREVSQGCWGRAARAARVCVELEWLVIVLQLPTCAQQLL